MIRVADYIAQFLADNGATDIFVLTGNGAMYMNDAIVSHPRLAYYCARNEAAAVMMAEGHARLKGSLGAVCVTAGPGATNSVPGLAEAWLDAAPIIILSGQVAKKHTTHHIGIPGLRTFGTAEINIIPVVSSMTKYAVMINDPESIRFHLEKAVYLALSGRPGPVWIDVPMDVQAALVDPKKLKGFIRPAASLKKIKTIASRDIEKCMELLTNAKRPLIVAGNGIKQGNAVEPFLAFIKNARMPIMCTRFGIDILPFSHPYNMGLGGIKGSRYCRAIMQKADVVLALGSRLAIPFVGNNFEFFDPTAKIIAVDIEDAELKKPGIRLELPLRGDVGVFLELLHKGFAKKKIPSWQNWLAYCQGLKKSHPMVTEEMRKDPIDLYHFMSRLNALAGKNHVFTSDSGSNYYIAGQVYGFEKGQREISSVTYGAMGLTIPLAIGASVAKKNMQILAVTGDGSLELNIQDLKTISYYDLNIKLFVINNGGYVSMRNWQDTFFGGRRIGSDSKSGVEMLNLRNVAKAFDLPHRRITQAGEIDSVVREVMKDSRPVFVEVCCTNKQKIIEPIHDKDQIESFGDTPENNEQSRKI